MKILVLGGDGYLGWPTALHLSALGHEITLVDNLVRREYDREMGVDSLVPIASLQDRVTRWEQISGHAIDVRIGNLTDAAFTYGVIAEAKPDTIVHFGEQRSAPYSMIDREHAVYTQVNNVVGTPERDVRHCRRPTPTSTSSSSGRWGSTGTPTSTSKRGSSRSPTRAAPTCCPTRSSPAPSTTCPRCTTATTSCSPAASGGCASTDLNQGIVYGQSTDETDLDPVLATRFDYDGVFGTVLNRFCVQAVTGHPLTVYGAGGQTRGMLNIRDTLACVTLARREPGRARRVPGLQPVHRVLLRARNGADGQAGLPDAGRHRRGPVQSTRRDTRSTTSTPPTPSCSTWDSSRTS